MVSATRYFVTILAAGLPLGARAGLVTADELCHRGDSNACLIVEVEARIDASHLWDGGKYQWVPSSRSLDQVAARDAEEATAREAQEYCTESNTVWISEDVAYYSRLAWLVAVDRQKYRDCLSAQMLAREAAARQSRIEAALTVAAVTGGVVGLFAIFWYRRVLSRGFRKLVAIVNSVGAK